MKIVIGSAKQMQKLGEKIAQNLKPASKAIILCLNGDLGSGKTTFLQGFAKGLKVKEKILSPTFVIMKRFSIDGNWKNFIHIDCYRLSNSKDAEFLGINEAINNPENIITIEWPEKIGIKGIEIFFKFIDKNKREVILPETLLK